MWGLFQMISQSDLYEKYSNNVIVLLWNEDTDMGYANNDMYIQKNQICFWSS